MVVKAALRSKDFFEYPEFVNFAKNGNGLSALELGCGMPYNLFDLHLKFQYNRLQGVDILENEKAIIDRYRLHNNPGFPRDIYSLKDCYHEYMTYLNINKSEIPKLLDKYDRDFKINTAYDVTKENVRSLGVFDLIFLVDLLHFFPFKESMELIGKIPECLNENGIVVMRVNHEANQSMTDSQISKKIGERAYENRETGGLVYLFDEKGFLEIIKVLEDNGIQRVINPEKYLNRDGVGYEAMAYIGQKIS